MSNYADGVPLYLNKKFYPIPRTKYKEVDFHIPLDALQDTYEFTLEKQALAECEQYEKEKKLREEKEAELRLKREIKAKADAEAAAAKAAALVREYEEELAKQNKGSTSREIVSSQVGAATNTTIVSNTTVAVSTTSPTNEVLGNNKNLSEDPEEESPQIGSNTVYRDDSNSTVLIARPENNYNSPPPLPPPTASLQQQHHHHHRQPEPLPYPPVIQPKPFIPYESIHSNTRQVPRATINLSDFESDTANPFDNVELNSINDMAVLATVLQNNITCSVPHNLNQTSSSNHHSCDQQQQHQHQQPHQQQQLSSTATTNNINVSVNTMNGLISQPIQYFQPQTTTTYLSHSSHPNSYNPHQWTPATQNPFYSHFPPSTVVTAATTLSTSSSSDSMPNQSTLSSSLPTMHRTGPHPVENSTTTATTVLSSVIQQQQQQSNQQQQLHPTPNPSAENFANFYFPFTSSQAQSRLKNHDREFS